MNATVRTANGTLDTVFNGATAAAMIILVTIYVHRIVHKPTPPGPSVEQDWRSYATRGERIGAANPTVVITEFSDFKCPFCRQFKRTLDTILARYPNDVAVVYRHFPISKLHPSASAAAYASICAAKQGRFQAYYNFAFEQQDSIGKLPWAAVADRVGGLDTVVFARCLKDSTSLMAVQYDRAVADRLKVSGTPTVLVNQWRLRGAPSTAALDSMVRKVLQGVR